MPSLSFDSPGDLSFPAITSAISDGSAEIECRVMEFFEELRNPLLRYVLAMGVSVPDGEEIIQEVFFALFQHLKRGKSRRNLRGWIFRVAHNLALKQRQAYQRSGNWMTADWTLAEKQPDPLPDPEEQMLFVQKRRRLLAVLYALPEEDQYCLRLRAEGLRYREIAAALGISLGAVSLSLTRSFARFVRADRI